MLLGSLAFLFLAVSVGLCYWWQRQTHRKRVREYFAGRVPLDDEEFYQAFYRDSGIPRRIPIIVRRFVAVGLWLPEEKLHPDDDLVVVMLGDHQPHHYVSGDDADHDVPISVIAQDPAVLRSIADWGWVPGLRPTSAAPVWPMDSFRDRFFTAFGSTDRPAARPAASPSD